MKVPMLDIHALHEPIQSELENAAIRVLRSGQYINGPEVSAFESELGAFLNIAHVIGVSSGTDALLSTLMALNVRPGDRIITTPYTFIATVGAIVRIGAIPVFADIVPETFNLDVRQLESLIDERTVGILPVHLFGGAADLTSISELADRHDLWMVEDAAQSLGGTDESKCLGTVGTAGIYSFFPAKNLGAAGDAGAVVTHDETLAERIRSIRMHGARQKYFHKTIGGNFRLDTLQAALLQVKLTRLSEWNDKRRFAAARYTALFAQHPDIACPLHRPGHVYNQYVITLKNGRRNQIRDALLKNGIECAVYYPVPLHLQPVFRNLGYRAGDFPNAEWAAENSLALPMHPALSPSNQDAVVQTILEALHP